MASRYYRKRHLQPCSCQIIKMALWPKDGPKWLQGAEMLLAKVSLCFDLFSLTWLWLARFGVGSSISSIFSFMIIGVAGKSHMVQFALISCRTFVCLLVLMMFSAKFVKLPNLPNFDGTSTWSTDRFWCCQFELRMECVFWILCNWQLTACSGWFCLPSSSCHHSSAVLL